MATKTKTATVDGFPGLREEGFTFLRGLKKNNDREWFQPRKGIYEREWQEPMTALLLAVEGEMKKHKVPLATKPKAPLGRIYRDIRFSADKSPYHTHVGGMLHKNGKKDAPGGLYIHVGIEERMMAIGFWQPDRPALTNWRLKMQEKPNEFLNVVKKLKSKKLELSSEYRLQRMPRGFEPAEGTAIGDYLRLTSFVIMQPLTKEEVMSPKLVQMVTRFALDAMPLLEYGWTVPAAKPQVFVD